MQKGPEPIRPFLRYPVINAAKRIFWTALAVAAWPTTPMRHLVAPEQCLPIAFGESGERTSCPERLAHIADGSLHVLHASFLIVGADLTGPSDEVIMSAEFHEPRVEVDLIATAFQHCAAKVVTKNDPRLGIGREG